MEEQEKRGELVPKIRCVKEVLALSKKLRLFFGIYLIYSTILMILFTVNHLIGIGATLLIAAVSLWFAKQENDYLRHLKENYGVS